MDWLRRTTTEPQSAPAALQYASAFSPQSEISPRYAARTRDPNTPENKYQVNQQCIYERRLPGGSYITAHLQRLQSGYYDSPIIHEDIIDNVRFVALNFVFHPSQSHFRFKYAEIRLALHNTWSRKPHPLRDVANAIAGQAPDRQASDRRRHSHATQTTPEYVDGPDGSVIRYVAQPIPKKPVRPKFLRHAPHLMYGAVSPETLDWNFNVAGSVGVTQGPANLSFAPSGGMKGDYKIFDMMKIQGSVRTLRSWYGHQYDIEDGEIVWTLEENKLQKSGLPREFTFVVLLTKGASNLDVDDSDPLTLDVDITAKVAGFVGQAAFPNFVTNFQRYQPYKYPPVDLDLEIGQVFEPNEKGRGFNFARLSSQFDDYVSLPGTTHSNTDAFLNAAATQQGPQSPQPQQTQKTSQAAAPQSSQQIGNRQPLPADDPNTLNLRVYLETSRDSTRNLAAPVSFLHLRPPPSRNPSPLPPASVTGSQKSHKRTITITSANHTASRSRLASGSSAAQRSSSFLDSQRPSSGHDRPPHLRHSLRKTRSRSELNSEYNSSPVQEKPTLANANASIDPNGSENDLPYSLIPVHHHQDSRSLSNPSGRDHSQLTQGATYEEGSIRPQPIPEHHRQVNDHAVDNRDVRYHSEITQANIDEEDAMRPQPDSETLPQHEFHHCYARPVSNVDPPVETPAALHAAAEQERHILNPSSPRVTSYSTTDGTNEWRTPPETTSAYLQNPSPLNPGQTLTIYSQTGSSLYSEQLKTLSSREQADDGGVDDTEHDEYIDTDVVPRKAHSVRLPIRRKPLLYNGKVLELATNVNGSGSGHGPVSGNDSSVYSGNGAGTGTSNLSVNGNGNNNIVGQSQHQKNKASVEDAHDTVDEDSAQELQRQHEQQPNTTTPLSNRPSYPAVQDALRLALAEHDTGALPGSIPSFGFAGSAISRSTALSSATSAKPAPTSVTTASARADSSRATTVVTPPLTLSKRDSMSEATGLWNEDTPPERVRPTTPDRHDRHLI